MNLADILSMEELISTLVTTVSCGGNLLMNVGPNSDGIIEPIFEERLRSVGDWLHINGDAIYSSSPWICQNDTLASDIWYTKKSSNVFAFILSWKTSFILGCVSPSLNMKMSLLGYNDSINWEEVQTKEGTRVLVKMPAEGEVTSKWSWVIKISIEQIP